MYSKVKWMEGCLEEYRQSGRGGGLKEPGQPGEGGQFRRIWTAWDISRILDSLFPVAKGHLQEF